MLGEAFSEKAGPGRLEEVLSEIRWLIANRRQEVEQVLSDVRQLIRGRKHRFGITILMLVTLLEGEMAKQKRKK